MSTRRTKQDKATAKHTYTYSYAQRNAPTPNSLKDNSMAIKPTDLLSLDPHLIADLRKTVLLSLFILGIELLLYRYL